MLELHLVGPDGNERLAAFLGTAPTQHLSVLDGVVRIEGVGELRLAEDVTLEITHGPGETVIGGCTASEPQTPETNCSHEFCGGAACALVGSDLTHAIVRDILAGGSIYREVQHDIFRGGPISRALLARL
jgi:hypothetical protein